MMDNLLPKIKTIRIMLRDMSEQQEAVFRMAFKMHNTTNYQILDSDSDEIPDLVLVDTDTAEGIETWKTLKIKYPDIPVAMFCSQEPSVTTPYLAKPVKFDTLFPILRSLAQGGIFLMLRLKRREYKKERKTVTKVERLLFVALIRIKDYLVL